MVKRLFDKYIVKALSHMALGLFCSLIMGLIVGQIAKIPGLAFLTFVSEALSASSPLVGACIGLAIAMGLGVDQLVIISSAVVGALGYQYGGPVGAYLAVIVGAELGQLISKRTVVDIILTPMLTIVAGGLIARYCCSPINDFMLYLGEVINHATQLSPFVMGIVVAVMVGCALTLPISSAAIGVALGLSGVAAGAAVAGCCANMVGFAIASYRDNGFGGLVAQGIGTSMLQMPNIVKKPIIWLPAIIASAVTGPISSALLHMVNNSTGAGMGTAGLVGQIMGFEAMTAAGVTPTVALIEMAVVHFLLPGVIAAGVAQCMRKLGWLKPGDMKLEV